MSSSWSMKAIRAPVAYFLRRFRRLSYAERVERRRHEADQSSASSQGSRRGRRLRGDPGGHRISHRLGAKYQGRHAGPCRRLVRRDQGDRRPGEQRSRLQGRHAGDHRRRAAQPLADPAEHHRHQQHRQHQAALSGRQGRAGVDPGRQIQAVGRDRAALHQGQLSQRQDGLDPGPLADRGDVLRGRRRQEARVQADRVPDHDPDHLQRRHARHPARPGRRQGQGRELEGPARSQIQGQDRAGRLCPGRRDGRRHGARGRAATSNTTTRAT